MATFERNVGGRTAGARVPWGALGDVAVGKSAFVCKGPRSAGHRWALEWLLLDPDGPKLTRHLFLRGQGRPPTTGIPGNEVSTPGNFLVV